MIEGRKQSFLVVNRVEVLEQAACSACGQEFSTTPIGEKVLTLTAGAGQQLYFFCAGCGDKIVGRVESETAKRRYIWDWAIPVRVYQPAQRLEARDARAREIEAGNGQAGAAA